MFVITRLLVYSFYLWLTACSLEFDFVSKSEAVHLIDEVSPLTLTLFTSLLLLQGKLCTKPLLVLTM